RGRTPRCARPRRRRAPRRRASRGSRRAGTAPRRAGRARRARSAWRVAADGRGTARAPRLPTSPPGSLRGSRRAARRTSRRLDPGGGVRGVILATHRPDLESPLRSERSLVLARRGMVCASVPSAAAAGVEILARGGNAIDAAIAAAAVLCVVEPMSTGVGGDCFALVWRGGELTGLNASGRAPAAADPDAVGSTIPLRGPLTITAPGAVAGWAALAERHGRLGLDRALADAIDIAERGFAVTPVIADSWAEDALDLARFEEARAAFLPAPMVGSIVYAPELAATLRRI